MSSIWNPHELGHSRFPHFSIDILHQRWGRYKSLLTSYTSISAVDMASSDTLFATTRLTLGLSRQHATRSPTATLPKHSTTTPNDVLDRRKRKRDDESQYTRESAPQLYAEIGLIVDNILTSGSTPLPRPPVIDPPLLAYRYLPISIAGDGAFSRTILAQDVLDPKRPIVAIKAMKPGFEQVGQQVCIAQCSVLMERNIIYYVEFKISLCLSGLVFLSFMQELPFLHLQPTISFLKLYSPARYLFRNALIVQVVPRLRVVRFDMMHWGKWRRSCFLGYRYCTTRWSTSMLIWSRRIYWDAEMVSPCSSLVTIVSATSMKLKLIDLGNAMPIDRTNIYYSDFEVQSIHYRAPEVIFIPMPI